MNIFQKVVVRVIIFVIYNTRLKYLKKVWRQIEWGKLWVKTDYQGFCNCHNTDTIASTTYGIITVGYGEESPKPRPRKNMKEIII